MKTALKFTQGHGLYCWLVCERLMFLHLLFSFLFISSGVLGSNKNHDHVTQSGQLSLKIMNDLQAKNRGGIIEFNTDLVKKFSTIDYTKRDFHLFILFNALDKETNCQFCS